MTRGGTNPLQPFSLRTTRPSWALKSNKVGGVDNFGNSFGAGGTSGIGESDDLRKNGPRIILFVMGGLTFSEIRSAYELIRDTKRDILIGKKNLIVLILYFVFKIYFKFLLGSTSVINPTQFIASLKELHKAESLPSIIASPVTSSLANLTGVSSAKTSPTGSKDMLSADFKESPEKKIGLRSLFKKK